MSLTTLEYRVWRIVGELERPTAILDMKNYLTMADYHFRAYAENIGINPLTITTQIRWTGETECRVTFISDAPEELLASAWEPAVKLVGLRTERVAV